MYLYIGMDVVGETLSDLIELFSGYVLDKANFCGRGYSHGDLLCLDYCES